MADGKKVLHIPMAEIHADMLRAFSEGLRDGVPATLLDGYRAYRDMAALVITNEHHNRVQRLHTRLRDARQLAKNARRNANEEEDDDLRKDYRSDAQRYTKEAQDLQAQIAQLSERLDRSSLPESFDGEVGFLLEGLRALLPTDDRRVSAEQAAALRTVMQDFHVRVEGTAVVWSARLLVPADARVVCLGPFTGRVAAAGRALTAAEALEVSAAAGAGQRRRALIQRLEKAGLPYRLAHAASLAPGDQLGRVLLGDDVIWSDCPPGFDHDGFNAHVRSVWHSHPGWSEHVYCQTSRSRQTLTDLVARKGGRTTVAEIQDEWNDLGFAKSQIYTLTRDGHTKDPTTAPWPPSVVRLNEWRGHGRPAELGSRLCPLCNQPATAVVRVPEVPDALLCRECLVMPSRPDIVFPSHYLGLTLA